MFSSNSPFEWLSCLSDSRQSAFLPWAAIITPFPFRRGQASHLIQTTLFRVNPSLYALSHNLSICGQGGSKLRCRERVSQVSLVVLLLCSLVVKKSVTDGIRFNRSVSQCRGFLLCTVLFFFSSLKRMFLSVTWISVSGRTEPTVFHHFSICSL